MLAAVATVAHAQLWVDFNSTSQDGGPHNNSGYQAYDAGHEVPGDFVTQSYTAFGTTIGVTPAWPNTTDARVQQMIDRSPTNDANWTDTDLDGLTDFIGIDTRTANGGNGDWDGTTGTPTYMTLSLSGLPANTYDWTGFHHDTENVHVNFSVELSTDGGATYSSLLDGYMSDSTPGGNPDSATDGSPGLVTNLTEMETAGSIYRASFTADGSNDVVLRYAPYSGQLASAVHNQIWGINGFQLNTVEPSNGAISWSAVDSDTTASDLIGGTVIPFTTAEYPGGNAAGTFFTGNGGDSGNADLNTIYDSHGWNGAGATITLDGLNAGEEYQVQLLGAGDTRSCCDTRNQAGDDGLGNVSDDFGRGNTSVIGTFTAVGPTQEVSIVAGVDNGVDPGLSGYILTKGNGEFVEALSFGFAGANAGVPTATVTVPEPAGASLFSLAALLLLGVRRRRS